MKKIDFYKHARFYSFTDHDMYLLDDSENPIYETGYYEEREVELRGMDIFKRADEAMYEDKARFANKYSIGSR